MLVGACKADIALLVLDITTGSFETNQLHDHANLAFTLGVRELICCLNKMDATIHAYSEDRYDQVQKVLSIYLADIGYSSTRILFLPVSSMNGENLVERTTNLSWYKGPTLLEALDKQREPVKEHKPLRMPVHNLFNNRSKISLEGRIESGKLFPKMQVTLAPAELETRGKSLLKDGLHNMLEAREGDLVKLQIGKVDDNNVLEAGTVQE